MSAEKSNKRLHDSQMANQEVVEKIVEVFDNLETTFSELGGESRKATAELAARLDNIDDACESIVLQMKRANKLKKIELRAKYPNDKDLNRALNNDDAANGDGK